jgi:hypothetical protein
MQGGAPFINHSLISGRSVDVNIIFSDVSRHLCHFSAPRFQKVETQVGDNLVQPRRHPDLGFVSTEVLPKTDERFLSNVFRIARRTHKTICNPVDKYLMPLDKLSKRQSVTRYGFFDDRMVRKVRHSAPLVVIRRESNLVKNQQPETGN